MNNSKRQQGKEITGHSKSRPVRRAETRLDSAMAGYQIGVKASKLGGREYTQPGSKKCW